MAEKLKIALTGNPNSGKTSLFNALTGAHQHVGNWGGVTVEFKEGSCPFEDEKVTIVDLPGTYSLSAYSLEEQVARDYIVDENPDAIIDVVDASNLERNLYLAVQLMEMGRTPILAFNMWDEARRKRLSINIEKLKQLLGVTIIPTVAKTGYNVQELLCAAVTQARKGRDAYARPLAGFAREVVTEMSAIAQMDAVRNNGRFAASWVAMKLLEHDRQIEELVGSNEGGGEALAARDAAVEKIVNVLGDEPESLIAEARYGFIAGALRESVSESRAPRVEVSDRIDTVLTHPLLAYPVFLFFMWLLFQTTFTLGQYPVAWIEALFGWLGDTALHALPPGAFRGLIVDGIIGGVGSVIVFLPNILILFFGISIMEDTGYMARAAFIMDKIMHKIGLHGKSFIPLLMGMGCSVPAIMATRTLESHKDRIKTILLVPLISCSARLPVYVLFAAALFPRQAGNVVFLFQFVFGTAAFFLMGLLFHKTLFRGEDYPFVMELPPYRLPTTRSVLIHMWQKGRHYLKKMGGVVLAFSVVLWAMSTYPRSPHIEQEYLQKIAEVQADQSLKEAVRQSRISRLESRMEAEVMQRTYIARIGKLAEPLVRPLGFDWRNAVSLLTGFVAKEVVVSSMGVLYAVGDTGEHDESLQKAIAQHFTRLEAIAFMFFVLLYTPCIVALVTIIRELKSWKWSVFSVAYQIGLAWFVAFVVYQGGRLVGIQ